MMPPTSRHVYVTHQGARVQAVDGLVAVAVEGAIVERWPPAEIERLLVFGNVQLTTQAMALLLGQGVPVALFSSRGRYRGQLVGPESGSIFLRLAQHARHADAGFRLAFARELILEKLRRARGLLGRHARNHRQTTVLMERVGDRLRAAMARIALVADDAELRGVEGAAAADYFEAFAAMVRPPFVFSGRSRHPGRDPVNALLNLGYVLLSYEIASRLEAAGFDPRIGYYHGLRAGRISLALDLVEPHRAEVIDRLTLSLLNRRMFSPDDFADLGAERGVRLSPAALRRYLALYEAALGDAPPHEETPRTRIQAQIDRLRRAVMAGEWTTEEAPAPAVGPDAT